MEQYETTEDKIELEDLVRRNVKRNCRRQECIVVMEDHVVRKRAEPGQTEVWFRHNDLQEIWESFQPEITEEEKKRRFCRRKRERAENNGGRRNGNWMLSWEDVTENKQIQVTRRMMTDE